MGIEGARRSGPSLLHGWHQVVELFDSQHANVANGPGKPGKSVGKIDGRQNTSDRINSLIAKIYGSLLPCEAMFLEHSFDFQVGIVIRIAVIHSKRFNVHLNGDS